MLLHRYVERTNVEKGADVKALLTASAAEEHAKKMEEIQFAASLCAISALRYLTDYLPSLDPGVMARILDTHDTCMSLVPLLCDPPWMRFSNKTGKMEGFEDNAWKQLEGDDKLKVNKNAAQVWLALNNLVVDPECRKKYVRFPLPLYSVNGVRRPGRARKKWPNGGVKNCGDNDRRD